MKKSYWVIVLLVLLAATVSAFYYSDLPSWDLGLISFHHKLKPSAVVSQQLDIYSDPKFGFEFQYPAAYSLNESHTVDNEFGYTKEFDNKDNKSDFEVSVQYKYDLGLNNIDSLIKQMTPQTVGFSQINATEINVAGFSAYRLIYSNFNSNSAAQVGIPMNIGGGRVGFVKDNIAYTIILRSYVPVDTSALDMVAQTFKFIN